MSDNLLKATFLATSVFARALVATKRTGGGQISEMEIVYDTAVRHLETCRPHQPGPVLEQAILILIGARDLKAPASAIRAY